MKNISEIEAFLPDLKTEELHRLECEIHNLYRMRGERVVYDDAYGIWLKEDQVSVAAEAFTLLDEQEAKHVNPQTW